MFKTNVSSRSLVDLSANFNSAVNLIRNKFQAIMRAEREERLQDQQLQHENSEVLQGRSNRHREDINELFVKYRAVRDQGNDLDEVQRVTNPACNQPLARIGARSSLQVPSQQRPTPTISAPISNRSRTYLCVS